MNTLPALQVNRSIQYNDKSNSNTTQRHIRLIEVVKRNHTKLINCENKFSVNLRNVSIWIFIQHTDYEIGIV